MSLFSATTGFLSLKPRVTASSGILRVRTSAFLRALGFFSFGRNSPPGKKRCQYCGGAVEAGDKA